MTLVFSSFSIIGVPSYFVIPYLITFGIFLYISNKYSDKTLKFWKSTDDQIFVSLGWFAFIYYLISTISRIVIVIIGICFRLDISSILNIEMAAFVLPIYNNFSIIIIITIVFDFMLLSGKGLMAGLHLRMYKHYKLILSGKEKLDYRQVFYQISIKDGNNISKKIITNNNFI
ncbi:MAG: hypothetical protein H0X03_05040 [Nitrosopumilus sp.]|nr:hypothetical protein [Nitrosopumilus sp.]